MKIFFATLILLAGTLSLRGQDVEGVQKGTVSYVTASSVYVKFESTVSISPGDTLFLKRENEYVACLTVSNTSSISCVCEPLDGFDLQKEDEIYFLNMQTSQDDIIEEIPSIQDTVETEDENQVAEQQTPSAEKPVSYKSTVPAYKQKIRGRVSVASYSNLSDHRDLHRMRYNVSFRGDHLGNSRFSTDNYISFRHTAGEWDEVRDNFNRAFKIYSLSLSYAIDSTSCATFGRKTNYRISSMGAIDGLQVEKGFGNFRFGAIAGTRPDMQDYSFNANLLQAGAYVSRVSAPGRPYHQTTLALAEQRNGGMTDRRFLYFQHSNAFADKLNVFTSFEFDLYENIDEQASSTFSLTNLYVSLRYRLSRNVNLSASYDARNNVIYYETYKSYLEQLIDDETRQGLRLGINVRPAKTLVIGLNGSMRFQKGSNSDSKNLHSYVNLRKIPFIEASASLTANILQTSYIQSQIYGLRLSRNVWKDKIGVDVYFKLQNYNYLNSEIGFNQKVVGADLNIYLTKKLGLYLYYEVTFEETGNNPGRFNTKLIRRF